MNAAISMIPENKNDFPLLSPSIEEKEINERLALSMMRVVRSLPQGRADIQKAKKLYNAGWITGTSYACACVKHPAAFPEFE